MIFKIFRNLLQHSRLSSALVHNRIKITYVNPKQAIIKKNKEKICFSALKALIERHSLDDYRLKYKLIIFSAILKSIY
jgi:hypothetical protein